MNNVFAGELTAEETVQVQMELDTMLAELKRMRVEIDHDQKEIQASQARTALIEKDIQTLLANRRRR